MRDPKNPDKNSADTDQDIEGTRPDEEREIVTDDGPDIDDDDEDRDDEDEDEDDDLDQDRR